VIGLDVGECRLGAARARHVLEELALMAGLPRAEGRPAATLCYGRGAALEGPRLVIPAEAEHVAREVAPEVWREGDVDVPLLYRAAAPPGEAVLHTAAGEPLLTRLGSAVYLAFDVVAAADYYLNGRGEVGWPRDRCGRPDPAGAPAWRRETAAVATVNRYARLLGRALQAACHAAGVPLLRFRYWPGGAPFAVAPSHDVDRLRAPSRGEMLRALLRPARGGARARYRLADVVRGPVTFDPLPAIREAEEAVGGASTFFVGARRRGPLDFAYDGPEAAGLAAGLAAAGYEVGLHGSYYSSADGAALAEERELLAAAAAKGVAGVRGHYLRLGGEEGWRAVGAAGFAYDASFGYAAELGWRAGAALPYRPFDVDGNKPFDFVEIPPAVMDGTLFQYKRLSGAGAEAAALRLVEEAAACGGLCPLLWHYRAFEGGMFPEWGTVFRRLMERAAAAGGAALRHAAVAARYRLNRGIAARGPAADGSCEVLLPSGAPDDVVFDVSEGWKVAGGDVRLLGPRAFAVPAGARAAGVTFAREGGGEAVGHTQT
jgi:hypothetical protein